MKRLKTILPSKRKLIQLYCALLYNANLKGFVTGNIYQGDTKQVCVPGLNCYSCPGAVGACPLGTLQGTYSADKSTWFYVGGILLLYCLLFGRLICGWLCPFGLVQELVYKIKTPKVNKSPLTRALSFLKYAVLAFFVVIVPVLYALRDVPLPAFCKYICPAGTLEGGIGLLSNKVNDSYFRMLGPLFTWKFLLMVSILIGCVFVFRLFCRFLCPLGALYGLFNRISLFGVTVDEPKCTHCNLCVGHCKMDIRKVGDAECIACGDCVNVCPTNAIHFKGFKPKADTLPDTVTGHRKARIATRVIAAVAALAVLGGVFAWYWTADSNIPVEQGNEIGDRCYSAALNIVNGDGIAENTIDPSAEGRVTIINFWGTWCTPCVNELPYFDQIATDYADRVSVIAVHTNMIIDTAPAYVGKYYPDSRITFASDLESEGYYTMLGGRGTYPYTVVLDENGIVQNIFVEALHYEDLQQAVDALL